MMANPYCLRYRHLIGRSLPKRIQACRRLCHSSTFEFTRRSLTALETLVELFIDVVQPIHSDILMHNGFSRSEGLSAHGSLRPVG